MCIARILNKYSLKSTSTKLIFVKINFKLGSLKSQQTPKKLLFLLVSLYKLFFTIIQHTYIKLYIPDLNIYDFKLSTPLHICSS